MLLLVLPRFSRCFITTITACFFLIITLMIRASIGFCKFFGKNRSEGHEICGFRGKLRIFLGFFWRHSVGARALMSEMPYAGVNHGQTPFIRGGDHFGIAD